MRFTGVSCILPVPRPAKTAAFYESLGFRAVEVRRGERTQIRLYRDQAELILVQSPAVTTMPNRALYGEECDVYLYTDNPAALEKEFRRKGAKLVRSLADTRGQEFLLEDIDGRWLSFRAPFSARPKDPPWYRAYSAGYLALLLAVLLVSVLLPEARAVCLLLGYLLLAVELAVQLRLRKITVRAAALLALLALLFSYLRVL